MRADLVRVQFWAPREERDAFDRWCKERNSSKNRVLLTMMRERFSGPPSARTLAIERTPFPTASSKTSQTQDLERRLVEEVVREADPLFAARVKQMLDRIKGKN